MRNTAEKVLAIQLEAMDQYKEKALLLLDTTNFTGEALTKIEESKNKQALDRDQVRSIFLASQQKKTKGLLIMKKFCLEQGTSLR